MTAPLLVDHRGNPIYSADAAPDYEGATVGSRLSTWGLSGSGPNSTLNGSLPSLRSRARTLYRNNPIVNGGVESYVANVVGTDISPRWILDNDKQREELQELWSFSVHEMDYYGTSSFYGQQDQVARATKVDGECLGRFRYPSGNHGLLVPLQVQLLEGDHLDHNHTGPGPGGSDIRLGIEWRRGKRSAYWLHTEHPGEPFGISGEKQRVPADQVLHVFRPLRPGMARGASGLAAVLVKLHEIDQYDDAEVIRKKVAAMWGGFITSDPTVTAGRLGGPSTGEKANEQQVLHMEPGTFPVLKPGQKVDFSQPADVGGSYEIFIITQFRQIARGLGITYEQLTGDLTGVNFSSIRAGLIEFRRLIDQVRIRTIVDQFCRPVVLRWLDQAVLAGVTTTISIDEYLQNKRRFQRVQWQPQGWDYVNPVQDRLAEQMDIRNGLDSRTGIVARKGRGAEEVDKEQVTDNARADRLGLVYDSDPRKTGKSGIMQKAEDTAAAEAAGGQQT